MYDAADSILAQKLAQIEGVGQVFVGGGAQARGAGRSRIPTLLNKLGIGLDTVRTALGNANANRPKGELDSADQCLDYRRQRPAHDAPRSTAR